jgi:hypothetical protein
VIKTCASYETRRAEPAEKVAELLADLSATDGPIATALAADLQAAADAGDFETVSQLAAGAPLRPRLWLAREFFRW